MKKYFISFSYFAVSSCLFSQTNVSAEMLETSNITNVDSGKVQNNNILPAVSDQIMLFQPNTQPVKNDTNTGEKGTLQPTISTEIPKTKPKPD